MSLDAGAVAWAGAAGVTGLANVIWLGAAGVTGLADVAGLGAAGIAAAGHDFNAASFDNLFIGARPVRLVQQ